ncbi:MAG: methyltransferase [Planctomycetaceae bacterium]|jgi:2-polyprenyl-3-methyl-5-hydroxy-6-metoxy-1,4-benzoquinol methylase|nr:methyltransferase [Planctomycetaceae bacterium]MBP62987.1 methyltransferase [Planctomycetaceae bacterium]
MSKFDLSEELLHECTCPACGHHVAVPFMDRQQQPLATLGWPGSEKEAQEMDELPLAFVRCVNCGHVYNREFTYENVPYSEKPNLMFNRGNIWSRHLERVCELMLDYLPSEPLVAEIGCGEGHLLRAMAERRPGGRYIGFDPNASMNTGGLFEARTELFMPARHVTELSPNLVISRHVLEHLVNPLGFLQSMAFAASWAGVETKVYIEVPCIDHAIKTGRTVDFYYEHNSHFTTESFTRMLTRTSKSVEMLLHSYNREVISGLVRLGDSPSMVTYAKEATRFRIGSREAKETVGRQLDELAATGQRVAIWGGTGKAAAFINNYAVDAKRFPLVVDSDPDKVGTHVPGQGQMIRSRDLLRDAPAEVLIIPMQWRTRDILNEMEREQIQCPLVLIEHEGRLINFEQDEHPY